MTDINNNEADDIVEEDVTDSEVNVENEQPGVSADTDVVPETDTDVVPETGTDAVSENDTADDEGDDVKNRHGKKERKDKKDLLIEELTDKYKRTFAEFDNFRKRTEKEKSAMYEIGARDIIEKILPIVDNFERGLSTVSDEDKKSPFTDGMDKVYKQLIKTLSDIGVEPMETVGKEFNPDLHNAVMHVEDESVGENIIVEEFQKGYTYRDSVVRHSMVKVAN